MNEIVPLEMKHLEDAAGLVAARYRGLRKVAPALPQRFGDPAIHLDKLVELSGQAPGVAALAHGKLVGFLTALLLPSFRGRAGSTARNGRTAPSWRTPMSSTRNSIVRSRRSGCTTGICCMD